MTLNPWEDCNTARLPFYSPIQAAIRWCGLVKEEASILAMSESVYVKQGQFPKWPCLFVHSESIRAAMVTATLAHGRDGRPAIAGDHVNVERRTVAHADLKAWIRTEFPADVQRPHMAWLFDDVERTTHDAITVEVYQSLSAERDALKREIDSLKKQSPRTTQADTDARLRVIAGLVEASGLSIHTTTAAAVQKRLEQTGYAVSADTCERMLSTVRKRLPEWQD